MKKRMISLALSLVLIVALLPTAALAADVTVYEAIPCKYDDAEAFSEGLAPVKLNGKVGYIDKTGKEVVPCKYGNAYDFSEGLAQVRLNGKEGYIDKTGKEVVPCKYDWAWSFYEGLAPVKLNGKWGFIDITGKEVIPCKYDDVGSFSEGLAQVRLNGKVGFIDITGKEVVPCKYDWADSFSEGLAQVRLNGKVGYIDKTGKEVIPCKYDDVGYFNEGLAPVELNGKVGYIDKTGKEVVPCKYDYAWSFSEGMAAVKLNGKWGFIDKTGKEVVPCKYDWAWSFYEGLAPVKLNGKCGYIDITGKEVVPCKYDYAWSFSEGMARVELNDKYGYLAIEGYVPLYLDGGSGTDYVIADSSGVLTVPTNPTREGYTFGGWYTDAALTIPWNFNDKVVNTLTLYAKWVPVSSAASTTGKSQSVIFLNGGVVTLDAYTLKADNGGDVTYVKLRDVAALLEDTSVKFNVDWRLGAIYVSSQTAYTTKNGTELKVISGTDGSYQWNTAPVLFDGVTKSLEGIVLTDGQGGGHTFFKLRDLGNALGFTVGWSPEQGIYIETEE